MRLGVLFRTAVLLHRDCAQQHATLCTLLVSTLRLAIARKYIAVLTILSDQSILQPTHNNDNQWIAVPSTMPEDKAIGVQFTLRFLTLHKTEDCSADADEIHHVEQRASVWTHDDVFEKLKSHESGGDESVDGVPRRVVRHVNIVSHE